MLACWFEPIENVVDAGQRAREGLIAGGDLANAGYTYYPTVCYLLDCAPSLDVCVAEVEAGLAFVRRTGSEQTGQVARQLPLAGRRAARRELRRGGEAVPTDRYAGDPLALFHAHLTRAIAAAIFGDQDGLARHTAAAMPLLPAVQGIYPTAVAHLLRGLALAGQARDRPRRRARRAAGRAGRGDPVAGRPRRGRAGELPAPAAAGRGRAGLGGRRLPRRRLAFDAARREVAGRQRPWHRALIAERAARFHLPTASSTPATTCSPRPARTTCLGRDREGRPARLGLPDLRPGRRDRGRGEPLTAPCAAPRSRPGRSTCSASCPPRRR